MKTRQHRLALIAGCILLSGCVPINQNLQVDRPGEIDTRQNVTAKCPIQIYPHTLLRAHAGAGARIVEDGGRSVGNQEEFDRYWTSLTLDPGQPLPTMIEGSNKPQIDWNSKQASFYPFKIENSCQRVIPIPMKTDCLTVTFSFSMLWFKKDCTQKADYPVYIYIYPKTNLPMEVKWDDDADGDGFSNESEISVGTDPLDPNSKP
jgi:hypothetical protein